MQNTGYYTCILLILMTCVSVALVIRLERYRRQIRHMIEELSMLCREDTNYRLSSCCRAGRTQEVIKLFNEIMERCRRERMILKRENSTYRESITSISHDIRTPLTSAKGYLQLLSGDADASSVSKKSGREQSMARDLSADKRQEYITTIEQRVDDVTDMLNQLFEYARVEAGELEFHMEKLNLTNIFVDTISMFYDDFTAKGCEPEINVPQTPCYVQADRHALIRVIENLVKNALVHGIGEYQFCMSVTDDKACICLSNRTDSIEQKDMGQIFDRFYTTDTSRTRRTTGLGLAIVKRFVENMNGEVAASLTDGIFVIRILFQIL